MDVNRKRRCRLWLSEGGDKRIPEATVTVDKVLHQLRWIKIMTIILPVRFFFSVGLPLDPPKVKLFAGDLKTDSPASRAFSRAPSRINVAESDHPTCGGLGILCARGKLWAPLLFS